VQCRVELRADFRGRGNLSRYNQKRRHGRHVNQSTRSPVYYFAMKGNGREGFVPERARPALITQLVGATESSQPVSDPGQRRDEETGRFGSAGMPMRIFRASFAGS